MVVNYGPDACSVHTGVEILPTALLDPGCPDEPSNLTISSPVGT